MILGLIFFLTGVCVAASSTQNVFVGVFIIGISILLYIVAIVFIVKAKIAKEKKKKIELKNLKMSLLE